VIKDNKLLPRRMVTEANCTPAPPTDRAVRKDRYCGDHAGSDRHVSDMAQGPPGV